MRWPLDSSDEPLCFPIPAAKCPDTKQFLDALSSAISSDKKVIIVTDAGFQSAWFRHIKSLGWDFVGRIRGNVQLRLGKKAITDSDVRRLKQPASRNIWGSGTFARAEYARGDDHFYLHKKTPTGRSNKRSRCRLVRLSQVRDARSAAKEPWLIFSSTDEFKPREIMRLYSLRM